ncbi:MAG TPA: phosphoribosyltransferase family protein [Microlunatus sp.]|nr:phosphoribosyltransferase family protein [Microlunatus sp.]
MDDRRPYEDRSAGGRALAEELVRVLADHDGDHERPLVLALPRGGVPVAVPIARLLDAELSVLVVRKLGAPGQPELAVGAIAAIEHRVVQVLNEDWVRRLGLSAAQVSTMVAAETAQLRVRTALFGATPPVSGRTVIVVDDGLATGATMRAALTAIRGAGGGFVLAAAPVGAAGACRDLAEVADLVVCPRQPSPFRAVGEHYRDFGQLDDADVLALLR